MPLCHGTVSPAVAGRGVCRSQEDVRTIAEDRTSGLPLSIVIENPARLVSQPRRLDKPARRAFRNLGACPDYRSEWTSRRLVMDWLGQVTWFVTPQRCFRPWRRPTAVLRTESACVRA